MKHLTLLSILFFAGFFASAQQTLTIPYQALVRDANGNPVTNQQIGARITLLAESITGNPIFEETHTATTNAFGQMELQIGSVETASFDAIDWSAGKMFIKLEVDINGGAAYQIITTHQLLAVPFAKYAENAKYAEEGSGWEKTEKGIAFKNGNVQIGDSIFDADLSVQGNIFFQDTCYISSNGQDAYRNFIRTRLIDVDHYYGHAKGLEIRTIVDQNVSVGSVTDDRYVQALYGESDIYGTVYGNSYGIYGLSYVRSNATVNGNSVSVYGQGANAGHVSGDLVGIYGAVSDGGTVDGKRWAGRFDGNVKIYGGSSGQNPTNLQGLFIENSGVSNTSFVFQTASVGGGKSLSVTNAGNVGIGTISPGTYKLKINGDFYATNMKTSSLGFSNILKSIENQSNNSDVKAAKFDIIKTSDLQSFIENDSTVDLVKMNVFLLEKIDQLIQSNIQQQEDNQKHQSDIEYLKSEIETLKNK